MKLVNAMINVAWFILPCLLQYIFVSIRQILYSIAYSTCSFLVLLIHILYFVATILASYVVNELQYAIVACVTIIS